MCMASCAHYKLLCCFPAPCCRTSYVVDCTIVMNASNINRASQLAKVFQQSVYSKLVETLPMDDAMFVAKLFSNDLLPGDLIESTEISTQNISR